MTKTRSTAIWDLLFLAGTIRNFVFFSVLLCFLPELSTHAAQKGHALYKDPPVRPYAYYLRKDVDRMRAAVDSRAMIGRGGTDPNRGMTAAERNQQIRAFEDQNGSFKEILSGGGLLPVAMPTTGVPQVKAPEARDPHWSWRRAGGGSTRQGRQGRQENGKDLCDEVVLVQVGSFTTANVDVDMDTIQFRGIEITTVGDKDDTGSSDVSGVRTDLDTIDYNVDRGVNNAGGQVNVNDDNEDDLISLESGDIVYLHPDSTVNVPGVGGLPGGVNPLTGANGRYFVSTRGTFPQAMNRNNPNDGTLVMKLHDSKAHAVAIDIDDATGMESTGIFTTTYPHLLATGNTIRVNPAPGSDNGVILAYIDNYIGNKDTERFSGGAHGLVTGNVVRVKPGGINLAKLGFIDNAEVLNTTSTFRHIRRLWGCGSNAGTDRFSGGASLSLGDIVRINQDPTDPTNGTASADNDANVDPATNGGTDTKLSKGVDYYVGNKGGFGGTAFSLHLTAANATAGTPLVIITGADTGDDTDLLTLDQHGLTTGDVLQLNDNPNGGIATLDNTVVPPLDFNMLYYASVVSTSEFTLHQTAADAAVPQNKVVVTASAQGGMPPNAGYTDLVKRLDPARDYFVKRIDDNTFTLHPTSNDARDGTATIDIVFDNTSRVDFVRVLDPTQDFHVHVINANTFTIHDNAANAAAGTSPSMPTASGTGVVDFIPRTGTVDLTSNGTYGFGVYKSLENGDAVFLSGLVPQGLQATTMNGSWQITGTVAEYFVSVTHSLTGPPTISLHIDRDDAIASPPVNKIDLTSAGGSTFKVWDYMNEGGYFKSSMADSEIFGDYWINPATFINNALLPDTATERYFWRNYPLGHNLYPGQIVRQVLGAWGAGGASVWRDDTANWYFDDPNTNAGQEWISTRKFNDRGMDPNNNPSGLVLGTGSYGPADDTRHRSTSASRYWIRQPSSPEYIYLRDLDPSMTNIIYWNHYQNALPR